MWKFGALVLLLWGTGWAAAFRLFPDEGDQLLYRRKTLLLARVGVLQRGAPGHALFLAPDAQ